MRAVYPVLFTETKDCFLVEVPDLEILTEGEDLNDAIEMARDAIGLACVYREDEKKDIPLPSEMLDVNCGTFAEEGKTFVSFVDVDSFIYRKKIDDRVVRRNVCLPHWLDYEAKQAEINVSKVLQEALINVLGIKRRL